MTTSTHCSRIVWDVTDRAVFGETLSSCGVSLGISFFGQNFCLTLSKARKMRVRVKYLPLVRHASIEKDAGVEKMVIGRVPSAPVL